MGKNDAIGVFDSGLGGLTAVRVLKKILPDEKIIYFGDTGRVPYGTRSPEIITRYALDDMNFLSSFGLKAALVACGTVSSVALGALRQAFDIPIMGVVEASARKACALSQNKRIALLATPATVKNAAHERYINENFDGYSVMGIGCPMFVPLVENAYVDRDSKVTRIIANEYISKLCDFSPDCIILGCTHYPIIRDIILDSAKELISKDIRIVDSGEEAAHEIKLFLQKNNLLSDSQSGSVDYYVSDEVYGFRESASLFLGENIENVRKIDITSYHYTEKK
ncbi:MAG: glutamate racemase [Clostridia bacterium]|nr:glutamate racemase [Clostridia bacterium]